MGAFIVNLHVRDRTGDEVAGALSDLNIERGWLAAPAESNWTSVWDAGASLQDAGRITTLCDQLSSRLKTAAIAFLVHDSDVFCYWLYDSGQLLDEYNSSPSYFDEVPDESAFAADCETLARFCRDGTDVAALEEILAQWRQEEAAAGVPPQYAFAEQRLAALVSHLGISSLCATTDCNDIGREIAPAELDAVWIGGEQPASEDDSIGGAGIALPAAPLLSAAGAGNVDQIEQLVADGADPDEIPAPYQVTPLAMAAAHGHTEAIRTLVALGADIHRTGPGGASPLRMAVSSPQPESVQTLLDLGADIHEADPQLGSLLHVAVSTISPEVLRVLLDNGAEPQQTNAQGQTPLELMRQQQAGLQQALQLVPDDVPQMALYRQRLDEIVQLLESAPQ